MLRDNAIICTDLLTQKTKHFFFKQRIHSLLKLKSTTEDENGFKINSYKVLVVCTNGTLGSLIPKNINLMTDWERQADSTSTPMFMSKDQVVHTFQNQNTLKNVYIVTQTVGNEQKLYSVSYGLQCSDLKLKMGMNDLAFVVNATSRQRDLIGLVDQRSFTIYKNDNGIISRFYSLNFSLLDIRGITQQAMFFFSRESIICINKKRVYSISIKTNNV